MTKMIRPGVVGAIYRRELLDVLRDRRTIFMMIVFPVVLYPLIGYVLMNLAMTIQEKKRMVVIINAEALPTEPALGPGRKPFCTEFVFAKSAGCKSAGSQQGGETVALG